MSDQNTEKTGAESTELDSLLNDALYFVCRVELKTKGVAIEEFLRNLDIQDIVCNNLIRFGETCVRIINKYPRIVDENPDIPWYGIRGVRNALAHLYDKIDYMEVWRGVQTLANIRKRILEIMRKNGIQLRNEDGNKTGMSIPD